MDGVIALTATGINQTTWGLLNFFRFLFLSRKVNKLEMTYINIMIQLKILLTWSQYIKTILTKLSLKTRKEIAAGSEMSL